ncbi:hypothetical protein ACIF8T_37060 [Streptomyces sp. NPDC085946]
MAVTDEARPRTMPQPVAEQAVDGMRAHAGVPSRRGGMEVLDRLRPRPPR